MNERVNVQIGLTYFSTAADLSGFPLALTGAVKTRAGAFAAHV